MRRATRSPASDGPAGDHLTRHLASMAPHRAVLRAVECRLMGEVELGGDAIGFGGRIGAMYRPEPLPQLSVGLMWRSKVDLDFEGEGDFDIAQPFRDQLPPDGDISTSITLPQSIAVPPAFTWQNRLLVNVPTSGSLSLATALPLTRLFHPPPVQICNVSLVVL